MRGYNTLYYNVKMYSVINSLCMLALLKYVSGSFVHLVLKSTIKFNNNLWKTFLLIIYF